MTSRLGAAISLTFVFLLCLAQAASAEYRIVNSLLTVPATKPVIIYVTTFLIVDDDDLSTLTCSARIAFRNNPPYEPHGPKGIDCARVPLASGQTPPASGGWTVGGMLDVPSQDVSAPHPNVFWALEPKLQTLAYCAHPLKEEQGKPRQLHCVQKMLGGVP